MLNNSSKASGGLFKTKKTILKEEIKKLIKTNKINDADPIHGTALNRAIKLKDKKLIKKLVDKDASIIAALSFLIENQKDITEIKQFLDFLFSDKLLNFAIEHSIVQNRNIKDIKELINLFTPQELIDFAVICAIKNSKNLDDIRELIDSSEVSDDCLFNAVRLGRLDLVKYFIKEKGFDVNKYNPVHGGPILSMAVEFKHHDIISYLLKKQANPNAGVISAVRSGSIEILEELFAHQAALNDKKYEDQPVALAVRDKHVDVLEWLLVHKANPNDCNISEQGNAFLIALAHLANEPENSIYKNICKLFIKYNVDTKKIKNQQSKEIIEKLKKEIAQEENNFDEGYISDYNIEAKVETETTKTGSRLEDTPSKSGIFRTFSLDGLKALDEDQTSLGGEVDIFDSEFN